MVEKLLIANRGEVALRILRTCRAMGIRTAVIYTKADEDAGYLRLADDTICIGAKSYLEPEAIIMSARLTGCDAVHPGYGFLAENPMFAQLVEDHNLTFIGPTPAHIELMGDKVKARQAAQSLGLDVLPGLEAPSASFTGQQAQALGFPLLAKATRGGGGRGMRVIPDMASLPGMLEEARHEAQAAFGSGEIYLEKLLKQPRHVEVQVFGDGMGRGVALGTRDCSVQRRHQKLIEEAPAPRLPEHSLSSLLETCVRAVESLAYRSAGTFEFLYDGGRFYFIEMNTRLQVEHPVTEMTMGVDIVQAQLELAAGKRQLPDTDSRGHAVECRINAENEQGVPSPGIVNGLVWPGGPGIRIDSHIYEGYPIPHQYDSLIAKIISHGSSRAEAVNRLIFALKELKINGIQTNRRMLIKLLESDNFRTPNLSTNLLNEVNV